eukprot:COSAG02_NODE_721_length_18054_cov_3.613422_8_plen_255_part_00
MVATPNEGKLSKHNALKNEVKLLLTGLTTDDAAVTTTTSAADANPTVSTPRLSAGSTQVPVNLSSEPYLRAIASAREQRKQQASAAGGAAHTTPVLPNSDHSCASSNRQHAAVADETVSSVEDRADYVRQLAQNGMGSTDVASSGVGFGKSSARPNFAHMRQQTQKQRTQRQPSSVDAQHCGRAVASAFSAAKRYSSDARQRCSKIAGLQSKAKPSAATLSCNPSFEHDWVQAIAAQPKLVTTPDGRRSWVRGW